MAPTRRRHMRISAGFISTIAACLAWLGICMATHAAAKRPNLVLLIADDMAWDDSGAYGRKTIRTPNLDKLAQQGMRFDRAFLTCSSCSPSRASIITGRYPHSTNAEQLHWPVPAEQTTFVELLKKAGYWTAAVGKWHLGDFIRNRFDVIKEADISGFQFTASIDEARKKQIEASGGASGCGNWIATMRERPKDKPFFLWLASIDPHRPYEENIIPNPTRPEDVYVPPYMPDVPDVRKDLALYYDEIRRLDSYVGQVLDELERQGEAQNTFVLFLSDNGRPFARDKTTVYDGGIRTPWLVRWPGHVTAGSVCSNLVSSVDIAPTFLELAGIDAAATMQGRSFTPLLREPDRSIRKFIYAEHHWHDYEDFGRAIRTLHYKYIRNYYNDLPATPPADTVRSLSYQAMIRLREAGKLTPEQMTCFLKPRPEEELYDLDKDPLELHNLAQSAHHARTLNDLRREMEAWQKATGDKVPDFRTPDEFDRETGSPLPNRKRPRASKQEMLEEFRKQSDR